MIRRENETSGSDGDNVGERGSVSVPIGNWRGVSYLEPDLEPCSTAFYPYTYVPLERTARIGVSMSIKRLGPLTIGDVTLDSDVRLDYGEIAGAYHVNLTVAGHLESQHRGIRVRATSDVASVYRPEGSTIVTRWPAGSRTIAVKISQAAVHESLERALNRPVSSSVAVDATMDTSSGPGRDWARMIVGLHHQLDDPNSIVRHPLVANPLQEALINGFLLATNHPHREQLSTPERPAAPAAVRTAMDIIEADPRQPLTTGELAARCHVGIRTLQAGFQRHMDMSPMTYLRNVRLRHAHEELLAADPGRTTVASIAHHWGFPNLGRFAAAHQAAYGELPIHALRAARSREPRRGRAS
jgi:AraC-like DNA-binding protein